MLNIIFAEENCLAQS